MYIIISEWPGAQVAYFCPWLRWEGGVSSGTVSVCLSVCLFVCLLVPGWVVSGSPCRPALPTRPGDPPSGPPGDPPRDPPRDPSLTLITIWRVLGI